MEPRPFTLKNGDLQIDDPNCPYYKYTLERVYYYDFDGDGEEEALVHVSDLTGCGSSAFYQYFYVYRVSHGHLRLIWKFSSGDDDSAGLKHFHRQGRNLIFELFGKYRIVGSKPRMAGDNVCGERCPESYSRIRVAWDGHRFRQRTLKFYLFPYKNIQEWRAKTQRN